MRRPGPLRGPKIALRRRFPPYTQGVTPIRAQLGNEGIVIWRNRCEALNEVMSGQGMELVYVELDDYMDVRFEKL